MVPVYHPNPGMDEQFPATNATLGKGKTMMKTGYR